MLSFRRFLIESYHHSLLLEDKRTEFVNRYIKHHREHPLVQQDPEKARELIGHSLQFGQNPEEHKFITGQLLNGTYKPGEDDPTIQATLGNWRKLTRETRGMHQGKTLADHDHDSVSALFRESSGQTKSSKAKKSAGDLAKYHIGTIDDEEHGPLDVYHIHQEMVPEGEDVQEETVRFQGQEYKFNTEKPYIDFSKAIKRVCPPDSTICVQHAGAYVKGYSKGHGFFLYTNKDGQTVYGHGNGDKGIVRHDNSAVKGREAQSIKDQTGDLLSGKRKGFYVFSAGHEDGIHPRVNLTHDEFSRYLNDDDVDLRKLAVKSRYFGPQHMEKALNDPHEDVRLEAVTSRHSGPQHMERALNDPHEIVRDAIIFSRHFGPEHLGRVLNDPHEDVRKTAKLKASLMIGHIAREHGLDPNNPEHHDEIINHFGSAAHEGWRRGFEEKNGEGTPIMKKTSDGETNINVPWSELHPEQKKDNIATAQAAIAALTRRGALAPK